MTGIAGSGGERRSLRQRPAAPPQRLRPRRRPGPGGQHIVEKLPGAVFPGEGQRVPMRDIARNLQRRQRRARRSLSSAPALLAPMMSAGPCTGKAARGGRRPEPPARRGQRCRCGWGRRKHRRWNRGGEFGAVFRPTKCACGYRAASRARSGPSPATSLLREDRARGTPRCSSPPRGARHKERSAAADRAGRRRRDERRRDRPPRPAHQPLNPRCESSAARLAVDTMTPEPAL